MVIRVLLIEDERRVAEFIATNLREAECSVDLAADGEEGLRLASCSDFDLIILDLMLPGISGSEVLARVRREKPDVPILVLTALDSTQDKVNHFEAGADDYLTKPFAIAELLARAKALVRRGAATRGNVLRLADLELDRLTQQVRRAGRRIELTGKEYALLEYLLSNPRQVLTRSMIVEHVWDQTFRGLTNIVEVYIRHLRSKVDDPFPTKLIRTVRGAGYCITDEPS